MRLAWMHVKDCCYSTGFALGKVGRETAALGH